MGGCTGLFETLLIILWLSYNSSFFSVFTVVARTAAFKLGAMYEEHLCAVALTGCTQGVLPIRLPLIYMRDPPLLFLLLSAEHRCFAFPGFC